MLSPSPSHNHFFQNQHNFISPKDKTSKKRKNWMLTFVQITIFVLIIGSSLYIMFRRSSIRNFDNKKGKIDGQTIILVNRSPVEKEKLYLTLIIYNEKNSSENFYKDLKAKLNKAKSNRSLLNDIDLLKFVKNKLPSINSQEYKKTIFSLKSITINEQISKTKNFTNNKSLNIKLFGQEFSCESNIILIKFIENLHRLQKDSFQNFMIIKAENVEVSIEYFSFQLLSEKYYRNGLYSVEIDNSIYEKTTSRSFLFIDQIGNAIYNSSTTNEDDTNDNTNNGYDRNRLKKLIILMDDFTNLALFDNSNLSTTKFMNIKYSYMESVEQFNTLNGNITDESYLGEIKNYYKMFKKVLIKGSLVLNNIPEQQFKENEEYKKIEEFLKLELKLLIGNKQFKTYVEDHLYNLLITIRLLKQNTEYVCFYPANPDKICNNIYANLKTLVPNYYALDHNIERKKKELEALENNKDVDVFDLKQAEKSYLKLLEEKEKDLKAFRERIDQKKKKIEAINIENSNKEKYLDLKTQNHLNLILDNSQNNQEKSKELLDHLIKNLNNYKDDKKVIGTEIQKIEEELATTGILMNPKKYKLLTNKTNFSLKIDYLNDKYFENFRDYLKYANELVSFDQQEITDPNSLDKKQETNPLTNPSSNSTISLTLKQCHSLFFEYVIFFRILDVLTDKIAQNPEKYKINAINSNTNSKNYHSTLSALSSLNTKDLGEIKSEVEISLKEFFSEHIKPNQKETETLQNEINDLDNNKNMLMQKIDEIKKTYILETNEKIKTRNEIKSRKKTDLENSIQKEEQEKLRIHEKIVYFSKIAYNLCIIIYQNSIACQTIKDKNQEQILCDFIEFLEFPASQKKFLENKELRSVYPEKWTFEILVFLRSIYIYYHLKYLGIDPLDNETYEILCNK